LARRERRQNLLRKPIKIQWFVDTTIEASRTSAGFVLH